MISARSIFQEIHENDESFRLFCSIAAKGEDQGGWENGRISALIDDQELVPKVARHGADEDKHGRIFKALLRRRGLEPGDVPDDTDYTMRLEREGVGLAHDKLRRNEHLSERDIIVYLAHSRVTEQRASEQMKMLRGIFGDHPEVGRAVRMISNDEENHLAFCHEELMRLVARGHGHTIKYLLRRSALVEIRVYRDVSLAVMAHMGRLLGWSQTRSMILAAGIHGVYAVERMGAWRRLVTLRMPERRNALGGPQSPESEAEFV
jgi:hypothetical protein